MSEDLRPCPFCGARTGGFCPDMSKEDDTIENIEESKKRAIKAWNRRANN